MNVKFDSQGNVVLSLADYSELVMLAGQGKAAQQRPISQGDPHPASLIPMEGKTRRHLFGAIRDFALHATNDREFRLKWASAQLGRRLFSFSDLTEFEAQMLISALEDYAV